MAGAALAVMAFSSCDENTGIIGQTLTNEKDQLDVSTLSFPVSTRTVVADSVFTLSNNCYLGLVRDPETFTDVKSEFATQFHLLDVIQIPDAERFVSLEDGKPAADSCDLILYINSPFNTADTLSAIKMKVHELASTMQEGQKYYSNYDPIKLGMVRTENGLNKSKMFSYRNQNDKDSLRGESSYQNNIRISLNQPYTDKNGVTYNNYGTYLIRTYHEHPEYFRNSYAFSHNVCPGFFFEVTDGYGFHAKVTNIGLRTFYKIKGDTTDINTSYTLAGTREVLQTTLITNNQEAINKLAEETEHTYLKTPAGLFTEVTLPVKEIMNGHVGDSLIAARISFQRLNSESSNPRLFDIPSSIMMIEKDSLTSFFENNEVPDGQSSYYTTYNYEGSSYVGNNTYNFINISALITKMWNNLQNGGDNWEQSHPNWNKVLLVPITYDSSASTNAEHTLSLTSTRLVGGSNNPNDPIKIDVVYAKFKD